jgi:CBS domain-containing protein
MYIKGLLEKRKTTTILTIAPDKTIQDAAAILSENKIGVLVVSSGEGKVDGILSERDIVRELGKRGPLVLQEAASSVMTAKVQTCAPTDTSENILKTMTEGRFRHIPVMDDGHIVAMISIGDLVKMRLDEIEFENNSMVEMIRG